MHWLLLRGLAREKRHYGEFPAVLERALPGDTAFPLDLPGFGTEHHRESPTTIRAITEDLRARFLKERPSEGPWSIFAISLGGMVALDWAARYPSDWQRVVVANTSAANLSSPWERFSPSLWKQLPGMMFGGEQGREDAIIDITVNSQIDRAALAQTWISYFKEQPPGRKAVLRQLFAAARSTVPLKIDAPLLVLTSKADRLVSWRCSEKIAKRLNAPLEIHDSAGHDLSLDAAEWICERIAQHGSRVPA